MPNIKELEDTLSSKGIELAGPIVVNNTDLDEYFVFVNSKLDKSRKRSPSSHTLNQISQMYKDSGATVSFVIVEGDRDNIDSSLKTMLFGRFPEMVRNSFASISNTKADVWIEPKRSLTETEINSITKSINEFLDFLRIELKSANFTQTEYTPTPIAILRTLRLIAPCELQTLVAALESKHFNVPNSVWMNHTLDKMRKAGTVVRRKDGEYFLSLRGLHILGSDKHRHSPDVARALAQTKQGE
ncbi:hypothetical protein FJ695_00435 [Labrenzia sp. PHM005]|nr:hypothetical protein FJ695_00435 [Labrenzia sp. PHM005]